MCSQNRDLSVEIGKNLRHVHDILKLILRIKKVEALVGDWHKLYIALESSLSILSIIHRYCSDETM